MFGGMVAELSVQAHIDELQRQFGRIERRAAQERELALIAAPRLPLRRRIGAGLVRAGRRLQGDAALQATAGV